MFKLDSFSSPQVAADGFAIALLDQFLPDCSEASKRSCFFHLVENLFHFPLLVLKRIDFSTGHVFVSSAGASANGGFESFAK